MDQLNRARRAVELAGQQLRQIAGILLHAIDIGMNRKDRFGMFSREIASLAR